MPPIPVTNRAPIRRCFPCLHLVSDFFHIPETGRNLADIALDAEQRPPISDEAHDYFPPVVELLPLNRGFRFQLLRCQAAGRSPLLFA